MLKRKETACPTCNRAFHEEKEARELVKDLRAEIDKIPDRVKSIKDTIAKYGRLLKILIC